MAGETKASISSAASTAESTIRPALIVDCQTLNNLATFLKRFFVGLIDESTRAALICPPDCSAGQVVAPTVEIIRHPAFNTPLFRRQNEKRLLELLERFKPTVLHCLGENKAAWAENLAEQLDLAYVITFTSSGTGQKCPISQKRCAAMIAPTPSIASELAKNYPAYTDRIRQINIGTFVEPDCACFSTGSQVTSMVVFHPLNKAGDFEPLFHAVRHLATEGYELILVVIGSGGAEGRIRRLRKALGLSQIVHIIPSIQPVRQVLDGADIFIQPQPVKVLSSVLLEAMSVGAVVAGCHGGIDDLLIENETAVIFDPADELSIYSRLRQLVGNRDFARQTALNAQNYLRKHFTVSKMLCSILQIYREAQEWLKR